MMDHTGAWHETVVIPPDHANPWMFSAYRPPSPDPKSGIHARADSPEVYYFDEDVFERDYTVKPRPESTKRTLQDDGDGGSTDKVPNCQLINLTEDSNIPEKADVPRSPRYTIFAVEVIVTHRSNSYEILPESLIEATPEPDHHITPPTPRHSCGELGAVVTLPEGDCRQPGKRERSDMLSHSCVGTPPDWEDDGPPLKRARNRGKRVVASPPQEVVESPVLETVPITLLGTPWAPIIIDDDPPHVRCLNSRTRPIRERVEPPPATGRKSVKKRKLVRYGRERALEQTRVGGKMEPNSPRVNPWSMCK